MMPGSPALGPSPHDHARPSSGGRPDSGTAGSRRTSGTVKLARPEDGPFCPSAWRRIAASHGWASIGRVRCRHSSTRPDLVLVQPGLHLLEARLHDGPGCNHCLQVLERDLGRGQGQVVSDVVGVAEGATADGRAEPPSCLIWLTAS